MLLLLHVHPSVIQETSEVVLHLFLPTYLRCLSYYDIYGISNHRNVIYLLNRSFRTNNNKKIKTPALLAFVGEFSDARGLP